MKFKKHISLFFAFLLLVSNTGFAFNIHYCGGKIASISFKSSFSGVSTKTNCCGITEKKPRCCKDKVFHFQKKTDQAVVKSFSFPIDYVCLEPVFQSIVITTIPNFKNNSIAAYHCDANAPPLFKRYHQYLFYDSF